MALSKTNNVREMNTLPGSLFVAEYSLFKDMKVLPRAFYVPVGQTCESDWATLMGLKGVHFIQVLTLYSRYLCPTCGYVVLLRGSALKDKASGTHGEYSSVSLELMDLEVEERMLHYAKRSPRPVKYFLKKENQSPSLSECGKFWTWPNGAVEERKFCTCGREKMARKWVRVEASTQT